MQLHKIYASQFLPFSSPVEIDFLQYPYACISGANGAGKSSLLVDALVYALFGSTRLRSSPIHTQADECIVTLDFEHNDQNAKIIRTSKQSGKNSIQFYLNEKDITERKLTDTQSLISTFLGFSKNLLLATCVAEQDQINLFSTLSPNEREKILSQMIGLQIWEEKKNYTSKWLSEKRDITQNISQIQKQIQEEQTHLAKFYESKKTLQQKIEIYETQLAPYIEQERTYLERVGDLDKKSSLEQEKWELLQYIKSHDDKYKSIVTISIESLQKKTENILSEIQEYHTIINKEKNRQVQLRQGREAMLFVYQKAKQFQETESYIKVLDEVPCKDLAIYDTCKLLQSAHKKKEERNTFFEQYKDFGDLKNLIESSQCWIKENEEIYNTSAYQLEIATQKVHESELLYRATQNQIELKHNENNWIQERTQLIHELQKINTELEKYKNINITNLHTIQAEKSDLTNKLNRLREEKSKLQGHIENIEQHIKRLQLTISDIQHSNTTILSYQTLHTAYSQIPSELFYQAIPEIEHQTNNILHTITEGHFIEFRIHKETSTGREQRTLDLICHTQDGDREFSALSGSEKFRQSLALRIALAKVTSEIYGFPLHFFISDESFSSLDYTNTQHMKATIQKIAKSFKQFYIITHIEELKNIFPHEICFTKDHTIQYFTHGESEEVNLYS